MPGNEEATTGHVQHQCFICRKVFKNQNHLRRHELSHTKNLAYQCRFCSREFSRDDALRRHFKTCSDVGQFDVIPASKRGRKLRACQRCRSKKLKCDGGQPCKRCISGEFLCSYPSVDAETVRPPHVSMNFMLNYTDPFLESVSDAYALSEAHAEPIVELHGMAYKAASYSQEGCIADLFPDIFLDLYMDQDIETCDLIPTAIPPHASTSIQKSIEALISLLTAQYESRPDLLPSSTRKFPIELARAVFTSNNIVGYVSAFFSYFHPHTPFLHRPSFDPENVSSHLLLAVSLVGSIFCTPQDHALSARCFFGLGEEYVFGLLRNVITHNNRSSEESIQIVQAAVLMHALQVNSNHEGVRHRIRVTRFPEIVAAMRCLGLFGTLRTPHSSNTDWKQFITDEVKIRLVARVFVTDCMSTLFFKSPSQITVSEMCGDLPKTDEVFEASTLEQFSQLTATPHHFEPRSRSLKDLTALFFYDDWAGSESPDLSPVGSEQMLTLIFAFHAIIFVSRTSLLVPSMSHVLHRAISRWKEHWGHVQSRDILDEKRLIGFRKYGLELWWLAEKILEVAECGDLRSPFMTSIPTDSLEELHDFIKHYLDR